MEKWIGKTVLFTVSGLTELDGKILDGKVAALSPSGKYVDIGMSWFRVDQVTVLEELPTRGIGAAPQIVPSPSNPPPAPADETAKNPTEGQPSATAETQPAQ